MGVVALSACWFGDNGATAPPGAFAPASIGVTARVVALTANAIHVQLSYRRANQTPVLLVDSTAKIKQSSTGSLGWEGVRGFPFDVDLTQCLIDPAHFPSGSSCTLVLAIELLSNGERVSPEIPPLEIVAKPGTTIRVARVIDLAEVGSVVPVAPVSSAVPVNGSIAVIARVTDVRGALIPDSPVTWRTSDATVARIDEAGVVTGLAPGTAVLTASAGGQSGSLSVVVTAAATASR